MSLSPLNSNSIQYPILLGISSTLAGTPTSNTITNSNIQSSVSSISGGNASNNAGGTSYNTASRSSITTVN